MIQIYTDNRVTYDSRVGEYDLQGLQVTTGLNKGGTAEIVMPPSHPAYNSYTGYRSIVEIYRDRRLMFRGRALYYADDFDGQRTVTCEGEMCFFQDSIVRPYLYQESPADIFADLIQTHNGQVESFKQFMVGEVTVTDPNDYVRLESESAEPVLAVLNKLVERCGGYIVFTDDGMGGRAVHWLASVGQRSSQAVEFGENLFDFSRSEANTDLATILIPYGAKIGSSATRVTVKDVNGGRDYIRDEDAVSKWGSITKTVVWDDVTEPANLLKKAQQYLDEHKTFITSLELTALDLSYMDINVDTYEVGDLVRVRSKAHDLDRDFQLVEKTDDLLDPSNNTIKLGKEIKTLTSQR